MAKKIIAVVLGFAFAPAFIAAEYNGLSGAFGNQIVGEPCAVRVYHTDFVFPPQGGKIISVNGALYFVRTYRAGCANAGAGYPVVTSSNSGYNPLLQDNLNANYYVNQAYVPNYQYTTAYNNPPVNQFPAPTYPNPRNNCY